MRSGGKKERSASDASKSSRGQVAHLNDDSQRLSLDVVQDLAFGRHHSSLGGSENSCKVAEPVRKSSELSFEL